MSSARKMARELNRLNSLDVRDQETVPRPKLSWEYGSYSLEDILNKFSLPRVIQCETIQGGDVSNFDFLQPMLLYRRRVCKKVTATSINVNTRTGTTTEVSFPLLVPEDYKGWFAVLDSRTRTRPVPHYHKVAQLSQSDCDTFLIGGTDCVEAVQKLKKDNDPVPRSLYPGDVLRMGNTYIASTKVRTSIFSKPQKKDEYFLLCTDQNDREVLLPFASEGVFYIVRNKNKRVEVPVRQIKDIITSEQLPCEVKLIFGRLPTTPCSFTGMMVLKNHYEESSVVASSIVNLRNILLEIPTNLPKKFTVAVNDNELFNNKGYKDSVRLCQEKAETYMRNIKVLQGQYLQDTPDVPAQAQPNSSHIESQKCSTEQRHPHTVSQISPSIQPQRTPTVTQNAPSIPSDCGAKNQGEVNLSLGIPILPSQRNPDPASVSPPLPIRNRHSQSPTDSRSPPRPPPQSDKPNLLNRVVPMVRVGKSNRSGQTCRKQQYNEACLDTKPTQNTPPEPPPKCGPSSSKLKDSPWKQKSITYGYPSTPIYLSSQHGDAGPDKTMSLAEELNLWKRVDETSQVVPASVSQGASNAITKTGSEWEITTNNLRMDGRRREGRGNDGNVYENIEDLRKVDDEQKRINIYANQNDVIPDDDLEYEPVDELALRDSANRSSCGDSGIMSDGTDDISPDIAQMSVTEVHEKLAEVGVKKKTRDLLKKEKVDGRLLVAFDKENMMSSFPFISNIELTKIGLFIKGWKPK